MQGRLAELDTQFERLLALAPAAREAALRDIARDDADFAAALRRLLARADAATSEIRDGLATAPLREAPPAIPGYRILAELGHGGMASVYAAERAVQGVAQLVALKLLRGHDDITQRARFLREQRILAGLRHPHIAALLDVGEVDGRPWIAMEYVDGTPIDRHFVPGAEAVEPILRSFLPLVDAVQSAHENLVVHRDLKPDNVLVARDGSVRLLDFGIAKPLTGDDGGPTRTGSVPMTLRYASPEQLRGDPVGVASDVYQLGLLLFRTLTGGWPFDEAEDRLPIARIDLDARVLRASESVSDRRLARRLRGDLDAILARCLNPRPGERYRAARDLQRDLERHLQSRPVHARRQTWRYVALRFVRRHRVAVASSASAVVALVAITIAALADASRADSYARQTQGVLDVAIEVLNESDPYLSPTREAASTSLRRIADRVLGADAGDPTFRARIIALIASVQERRGDVADAVMLLRDADDARVAPALRAELALALARGSSALGDNAEALAVLDRDAGVLGHHQPLASQVLRARIEGQAGHGDAALARLEALTAQLADGDDSLEARAAWNQLAIARGAAGDRSGSIDAAERALHGFTPVSGRETSAWMTYAMNRAVAYGEARRYADADRLHREVAEWARRTLGEHHPQLAIVERSRAAGLMRVARFVEAHALLEAVDLVGRRHPLPMHRDSHLRTIATARMYAGEPSSAIAAAIDATAHARREMGEYPGAAERAGELLAWLLVEAGAYPEAARMLDALPVAATPSRVAALARMVLTAHGFARPDPRDAAVLASRPCTAAEAALLEARLAGRRLDPIPVLPAECDGHSAARFRALGGQWEPGWATDFPLPRFTSPLLRRIDAGDREPVALPAALARRLEREVFGELPADDPGWAGEERSH